MGRFMQIIEYIYSKAPFQKKRLEKFFSKKEAGFFIEAEEFAQMYIGYLESQKICLEAAVDSYLKLCNDVFIAQLKFAKTGCYPAMSMQDIHKKIYNDSDEMKSYMIGVAISQFLWPTHYEIFHFFQSYLQKNNEHIKSYLEIGPGHGLFLTKALKYLDKETNITAVDISQISINITKSIIEYLYSNRKSIKIYNADMLKMDLEYIYDFIVMGEVIEHVNFPKNLLIKLEKLLSPKGEVFISTCVNCPANDHVYHFKTVDEIRHLFQESNLKIKEELVLPVEDLSLQEILDKKITINYCAVLFK